MKRDLRPVLAALAAVPALAACSLTGGGETNSAGRPPATRAALAEPTPERPGVSLPSVERPRIRTTAVPMGRRGQAAPELTVIPVGQPAAPRLEATEAPADAGGDGERSVPDVVSAVTGSVVEIIVQTEQGAGTGTGFIIDRESNIVTNNHVVEDATRITVVLGGNKVARARLIGRDPFTDLAVVRIEQKNLPVIPLGNSDRLRIGEQVVAIGHALGLQGGPTVSTGVVSALKRAETEPSGDPGDPSDDIPLYDLIQTDAAINPGNSGGPLVNMQGEVIGVNTLGQRATETGVPVQGINFAVSVNTVRAAAQELIARQRVDYPFLNVRGGFLSLSEAIQNDIRYVPGYRIAEVQPGGPADDAGLRAGDIISRIGGKPVTDESAFVRLLRQYDPGETITLTIERNGQEREVRVKLGRRPIPR